MTPPTRSFHRAASERSPRRRSAEFDRAQVRDRTLIRSTRLLLGLALFSLGLALLVHAHLGLDPWTVFSDGLARQLGWTLGQVTVASSAAVLMLWIPLRQRPGVGTVANALVVGPLLDLGVAVVPSPERMIIRCLFLILAILLVAAGTGLYVGVGWGPGPRDGLMTGLAELGMPIFIARTLVEGTVLVAGWALGGSVGAATVLFALTVGPLVGRALPRLVLSGITKETLPTRSRHPR